MDSGSGRATVGRAAASFRPYTPQVVGVVLLILVTAGLGVVNPLLIRSVFDDALFAPGGIDMRMLWILSGIMTSATVVSGGLGIIQTYLTNEVGQRVMRDLRDRLYSHLQRQSLGFFTGTRTGEIQSRIANDVGGVQNVVTNTLSSVLSNTVIFISTLVAMLILSWELTVVSVIAIPVFVVISRFVGERTAARDRAIAGGRRGGHGHHPGDSLDIRHHARQAVRETEPGDRALPQRERAYGRSRRTGAR